MRLLAINILWHLCSQTSLLMLISVCSWSPVLAPLPQLHLKPSGVILSQEVHSLDPLHLQNIGLVLFWEFNSANDLREGGVQVVMGEMGNTVITDGTLLFCCVAQSLAGHGHVPVGDPDVRCVPQWLTNSSTQWLLKVTVTIKTSWAYSIKEIISVPTRHTVSSQWFLV